MVISGGLMSSNRLQEKTKSSESNREQRKHYFFPFLQKSFFEISKEIPLAQGSFSIYVPVANDTGHAGQIHKRRSTLENPANPWLKVHVLAWMDKLWQIFLEKRNGRKKNKKKIWQKWDVLVKGCQQQTPTCPSFSSCFELQLSHSPDLEVEFEKLMLSKRFMVAPQIKTDDAFVCFFLLYIPIIPGFITLLFPLHRFLAFALLSLHRPGVVAMAVESAQMVGQLAFRGRGSKA